jgi:hypothetical protein
MIANEWGVVLMLLAAAAAPAETSAPEARPLREVQRLPRTDGVGAWVVPIRCDAAGNLFVLPMPPRPPAVPRDVVRVAVRGPELTRFDVGAAPEVRGAAGARTHAVAVDGRGSLHAVVSISADERLARQYVVSFDAAGRYRSAMAVDPLEMEVDAIEAFPSGAFLLQGHRGPTPRLAVLSRGGLADVPLAPPGDAAPSRFDFLARGGDGRVYAARRVGTSIVAIDDTGRSREAFALAPAFVEQRVDGLWASGRRVVVAYEDEAAPGHPVRLAVYDVGAGRLAAVYGPVEGLPACYEAGPADTFTFLRPDVRSRLSP